MKQFKIFLLASMVMLFTACGGSSSSTAITDPPPVVTEQQVAIAEIMKYAETGTPVPTVQDYETAGVTGVTEDNLDEVNAEVAGLTPVDVNTPEKIQAIVEGLPGVGLPPPVIMLNGDNPMTITQGDTFTDPGATAKDATGADVPVTATNNVDTSKVGSYTVTYTATDSAGTTATATRTVNVVAAPDTTPPVIMLNGDNPMTITQGDTFTDPGATAKDATGADVPVTATNNVDTSKVGSYTVTYTATDSAGTTATATRTVNVIVPANEDIGMVTDSNAAANTVAENAPVGTAVGITAQATDPDSSDTVTYSLTNDAGGLLAIDVTAGVVTVAAALDYETATTHSITVLATSSDSSTSSVVMMIAVTDVNENPANQVVGPVTDNNAAANTAAEDATTGTVVGITAQATDPDSSDTVTYALTDNAGGRFVIDGTSGVVTVALAGVLNFEDAEGHSITVLATSSDSSTSSEVMTIAVTDVDEPIGYGVISYGGYQWLDRNVGADEICTDINVTEYHPCIGDYYQWGRAKDGHEDISSITRNELSKNANPKHSDFINTETLGSLNWITRNITDLWQDSGSSTNNGICPDGWHVPSVEEFATLDINTSSDAFTKIRLHHSGYREGLDGIKTTRSTETAGLYWTSKPVGEDKSTGFRILDSRAYFNDWGRADGFQIRCTKDIPIP